MTELSAENLNQTEKRYKTAAFLVFVNVIFVLLLCALAFLLIKPYAAAGISENTKMTLWVAALFAALGTFIFRRMLYRWERLRDTALLKGISGLLKTLTVNTFLLASMAAIVAIIGFVIALLTGEPFEMLRSTVIALVIFAINFPRKSIWKKIVSNLEKI